MNSSLLNLKLLSDKEVFVSIHETKRQFKELFIEISNGLENRKLKDIYPNNKGVKVSMGNELQKCPYQVLDIFRDFDKKRGHNIRVLNWWGHGLYLFVFFGKELAKETIEAQDYFRKGGFSLAIGSSPWDYAKMINLPFKQDEVNIGDHLLKFGYLQWYKEIELESDLDKLKDSISAELDQIFHFHRI